MLNFITWFKKILFCNSDNDNAFIGLSKIRENNVFIDDVIYKNNNNKAFKS